MPGSISGPNVRGSRLATQPTITHTSWLCVRVRRSAIPNRLFIVGKRAHGRGGVPPPLLLRLTSFASSPASAGW